MHKTRILSTGSAFPKSRVTNQDLTARIETTDEWIYERTGIRARRIADTANGESNHELGAKAAFLACERAGIDSKDIQLILYATVSGDRLLPSTACLLQEKLGAKRAAALDIAAACSGFVYGLSIADSFIKCGQYENILLLGAEVLSPYVDWTERGTCILFGDGAGAAILGRSEGTDKNSSRIYSTHLYADGWMKDLFYLEAGGSSVPMSHDAIDKKFHYMQMKGREIFKIAVRMLADTAIEALEKNGFTIADVDWLIPHQANARIIEAVAKRLDFPMEKVIMNLEEYGNTSAATVPTAMDQAIEAGKIKRGDLVLISVFGAGLTYGSALLRY